MHLYFAPLEGITGHLFRCAYEKHFGGIDRYYSPFVTTRDGGFMKHREKNDILPENNSGLSLVPQILTNQAESFCQTARHMEEMGYREVNLNLGCPSGTVTAKGKGAGFLRFPDELDRFLDYIFEHSPIAVSVKSRIGFYETEEFDRLLDIYNQYPIKELILHLRTREEMYKAPVHREVFSYAVEHSKNPLCYNGDICSRQDLKQLLNEYPSLNSVMIGRGFLRRPGFATSDGAGNLSVNYDIVKNDSEKITEFSDTQYYQKLFNFITELQSSYERILSGETPVLFKMKELWSYLMTSVPDGEKCFKKIKKTKKIADYNQIVREILLE